MPIDFEHNEELKGKLFDAAEGRYQQHLADSLLRDNRCPGLDPFKDSSLDLKAFEESAKSFATRINTILEKHEIGYKLMQIKDFSNFNSSLGTYWKFVSTNSPLYKRGKIEIKYGYSILL